MEDLQTRVGELERHAVAQQQNTIARVASLEGRTKEFAPLGSFNARDTSKCPSPAPAAGVAVTDSGVV